jgi:predicted Zn-dependent peptidase
MVFFFYGSTPFRKILRLANKYMLTGNQSVTTVNRKMPSSNPSGQIKIDKNLHQTHVVIGGKTWPAFDARRTGLHLLNNILGGPGMNSRLNMSLREKHGLVYSVESGLTSYTDAGLFTIYFGCDRESETQCLHLTYKELQRLRDNKLSTSQFAVAVKQWKGQLGIMSEQRESLALGLGKSFLRFNKYDDLPEIYRKIDALTVDHLLEIANEIYDENRLFRLIYQ